MKKSSWQCFFLARCVLSQIQAFSHRAPSTCTALRSKSFSITAKKLFFLQKNIRNMKHNKSCKSVFCTRNGWNFVSVSGKGKQRQQNGKVIIIIQKLSEKDFQFSLMHSARVAGTFSRFFLPYSSSLCHCHHFRNFLVLMTNFSSFFFCCTWQCMEMSSIRLSALASF